MYVLDIRAHALITSVRRHTQCVTDMMHNYIKRTRVQTHNHSNICMLHGYLHATYIACLHYHYY